MNLWCITKQVLEQKLQEACQPYGGLMENRFSSEQLSVAISGDVLLRYQLASLDSNTNSVTTTAEKYLGQAKHHVKQLIQQCLPTCKKTVLPNEEDGALGLCVVLTPRELVRPPSFVIQKKRIRKRFRGNKQPEPQQGGDARVNLEQRVGESLWNASEVQLALDRIHPAKLQELQTWFQQQRGIPLEYTIKVAVWRRPFYLKGLYTKSRRDVSQTPFYVVDNGKTKRLGVTSVEEEICGEVTKACGGISTLNNVPGNVVYGMVKFHASGREDMDVCMMLPSPYKENVGGRPFCCQVIDAFGVPRKDDLERAVCSINHEKEEKDSTAAQQRHYGNNPMGVDVSSLEFVPSSCYRNLQADTESKVKHYGCLCWCERTLDNQQHLEELLLLKQSYPLQLQQQTPIRVLHRRSRAVRIRHVLTLRPIYVSEHWFRLHLSTDAGTYVKEFVHGDLGRTTPSVASILGCKTDILELDCEGIEGV